MALSIKLKAKPKLDIKLNSKKLKIEPKKTPVTPFSKKKYTA